MSSELPRISSLKTFPLTPPESEVDESEIEDEDISEELVLGYCVNLVPETLGLEKKNEEVVSMIVDRSKYEYIKVENVVGGITNKLYKVINTKNNKTVLVRIFGSHTSKIVDRTRERYICELLSRFRISKKIYCYFKGGQIEEWIDGRNLSEDDIADPRYTLQIAQNLKRLHSIKIEGEMSKLINKGEEAPRSNLWITIWKYFKLVKKYVKKNKVHLPNLNFESLEKRILILEEVCNKVNSPLVLCHCDLLAGNIILLPNDDVRFIDFEYCCCMERAYDIANHFVEYTGFKLDKSKFPTLQKQRDFIREYLKYDIIEYRPSLEGFVGDVQVSNDDDDIDNLLNELQPFFLASHLFWGVWSTLQTAFSTLEFGFSDYAVERLNLFMNDSFWDSYPDLK